MARFADLVSRLSHDRHLKGRQFERICRWYLENDPVFQHQLRKVWLWKDWPGRWGADAGIDLVAETHSGDLWAVQAKAYARSASVTKADLDTFLSESSRPQFSMRLLIATTDHMSPNAHRTILAQEKPVRVVTASELGRAFYDWPAHPDDLRARPLPRKKPRPHQRAAIKDVLAGFKENDRGQLIMACGTGKTMVSLWVWEALDAPTAVVVLPSLSLLAQTVREWCANARSAFDFLAVCSDESVTDSDLIIRSASEFPFATTTDAGQIGAFLTGAGDSRRVIFSTYQSTPRIAEALAVAGKPIDLVVADEAHRCAGRVDGGFSTVLKDEQIPSRRRLFMTATPRYLSGRVVKAAEDLDVEVVSMDDEAVFGPVFHALTFGEAISQELLTDYQVAIVGVEGSRYREMAEQATLVQQEGGRVTDARTLAAQAALLKGMAKYDLKRCVTFHSRVARARHFADSLEGVSASLPADERPSGRLWADHVSGAMRSASRDSRLDRLRALDDCERGLLANARCLAEGVDVPTLDAIAFVDPRRSQVDIVQAVGRVIRKAVDKRLGTVLLPVFVADSDDSAEAVGGSAFDPVWRVLSALRAHDNVLADELDALRTSLGRYGTPGHPSKVVLDLPASVSHEFLRAFDVRLVQETTESWLARFGVLLDYVEREGHALVPALYVHSGIALGQWVVWQRGEQLKGRIEADKVARLEALPGWSWDPFADRWERSFAALLPFVEREGHARVPLTHMENGVSLGRWVINQRRAFLSGRLDARKAARLEAVPGWTWDPVGDQWESTFDIFLRFVEREGHARVPVGHMEDGVPLRQWVGVQRRSRSRGQLDPEKAARLEAVPGWSWDPFTERWERAFAALMRFVEREGHSRVPKRLKEDGFALGIWVGHQREAFLDDHLASARAARLEALPGWSWDPALDEWESAFKVLVRFVGREGHTRAPRRQAEGGFALGQWVSTQRRAQSRGYLDAEKAARLEALPRWTWDSATSQWETMFEVLGRFVEREGHARVPQRRSQDGFALGHWVMAQRRARSRGQLDPERAARLEALPGWSWDPFRDKWDRNFALLREFAKREGHAHVPTQWVESDTSLGEWVQKQRRAYGAGRLRQERIDLLESLPGWVWSARNASANAEEDDDLE